MNKIKLIICENFYPEYKKVIKEEDFREVELIIYPNLCENKKNKHEVNNLFRNKNIEDSTIICSKNCDALKLLPSNQEIQKNLGKYCFSHLTSDALLDHLIAEGGYLITPIWLNQWKDRLRDLGFNQKTARRFFQETTQQLVLITDDNNQKQEDLLKALSSYLDLSYMIMPVGREKLTVMLKSIVYEWRLKNERKENKQTVSKLRTQCAEYSAIFDILSKISSYGKKRDVITQIDNLFSMVFGAQDFSFWSSERVSIPEDIKNFKESEEKYILIREENRFCIKITWGNKLYGVIDVKGFLFPKYIDRYLNLALEISKISGLVFHNNTQYEKILASENELKYLSFHDSMTGLYNRTYINEKLYSSKLVSNMSVFMFDIDRLKYVNDNYGHSEGDLLIKRFSDILKKSFRETDIVARIGGDEFVAFLYNSDKITAEIIKERLIQLIKKSNKEINEEGLKLSVSIGNINSTNGKETIANLIKKADKRMYEDKNKRKKNS